MFQTKSACITAVASAVMMLSAVVLTSLGSSRVALADEQEISVKELPKSVREALRGVDIEEVERVTENGKTVFEIVIGADDAEVELTGDAEGRLLKVEVDDEGDDDEGDDDEGDDDVDDDDDDEDEDEDDDEDGDDDE